VGHQVDTALVTDALLDDALDAALRQVNRYFPTVTTTSFATVANQQTYTPLPAAGRRIAKIYYPNDCPVDSDLLEETGILLGPTQVVGESGRRRRVEPHETARQIRDNTFNRRVFQGEADVRDGTAVRLIPVPGTTGLNVYYDYEGDRYADVDNVDERHERPFLAWARKHLHEALAAGRGAIDEVTAAKGYRIKMSAAVRHAELAEKAEKEFHESLPIPGRRAV